ncbi:hypothetical protein O0L34_g11547 [Tuta absoluta]|nr:hypothetical protein O0L34_g11547 [Tuta absoluta]
MQKLMLMLVVSGVVLETQAYQMTNCQLLKGLRNNSFPEEQLRDWMCLVQHESGRKTDMIMPVYREIKDHGLFQIRDNFWCSNTAYPGKGCNVTCAELVTDDITKAAECAKMVYERNGFKVWYGWRNHCQGALPSLPSCEEEVTTTKRSTINATTDRSQL